MIYKRNGVVIGVYHLPDHKRPVLGVYKNHALHVVASFSSNENADYYDKALEQFLEGLISEVEK